MSKVYAFTDESGSHGWDFEKDGTSRWFVVAAIIVEEENLDYVREKVEEIRKRHFQTGEIKSMKIANKTIRRKKIIDELSSLPYNIFAVVCDKSLMDDFHGLRYKPSFYKWLNNVVHKSLSQAFSRLTVVADEIGGSDYMKSFCEYVKTKEIQRDLLGEFEFTFHKSDKDVLIQVADLIAGTLSRTYKREDDKGINWLKYLKSKILNIYNFPQTPRSFTFENNPIIKKYDPEIAEICIRQVDSFFTKYQDDTDDERKQQVIVLRYLTFRFLNNDLRKFIKADELTNQLKFAGFKDVEGRYFRTKIIAPIRDAGVPIASSSKGYKIPTCENELDSYIQHGVNIIEPMVRRMQNCKNLIKLGTKNRIDLFDKISNEHLKSFLQEDSFLS